MLYSCVDKDVQVTSNSKIVSFEVKSLFTSAPVNKCLQELLIKSKFDPNKIWMSLEFV